MKKKILFVIHSLKVGGMERVMADLANSFVKQQDIDIHIILYGIKRDIFYDLNPAIIVHKPNFEFDNTNRNLSTIKTLGFLRKKIKIIQPNTILSFGEYWNNLVLVATLGMKVPIYIADRATPMLNLGKVQNNLRKYLYPRATGLIVQTKKAKSIYKESFKNLQIEVIGNPITQIDIQNEKKRENIILNVGRLVDTKHQDRLINIFSKLKVSDWKLVIVGGNSQKQNKKETLEKLIKSLKLEERVVLAGNQKDVKSYYLKSKIFAFTSSSEGFPNVIGEAMASALPVIAYDCMAGPSEIITDGEDGFLVPLFDDALFEKKLNFLVKNEEERIKMGSRAIKNVDRFSSQMIAKKFLNFIFGKEVNK